MAKNTIVPNTIRTPAMLPKNNVHNNEIFDFATFPLLLLRRITLFRFLIFCPKPKRWLSATVSKMEATANMPTNKAIYLELLPSSGGIPESAKVGVGTGGVLVVVTTGGVGGVMLGVDVGIVDVGTVGTAGKLDPPPLDPPVEGTVERTLTGRQSVITLH